MKKSRLLSGLITALLALPAAASGPQICGLSSGAPLASFADSVDEMRTHTSPVVSAGLEDLYSFPDLQNLLASFPRSRFCVSSLVVAKNIYQYDMFLITVVITEPSGRVQFAPLVFQTASVQAHHNIGPKPWFGLASGDAQGLVRQALAGAEFRELPKRPLLSGFTPTETLPLLFAPKQGLDLDPNSTSYVYLPGIDPEWTTFLVSRLNFLDTGNPYASSYIPEAGVVQVQEASGRVRIAPLKDFYGLFSQLIDRQDQAAPADLTNPQARLQRLRQLIE